VTSLDRSRLRSWFDRSSLEGEVLVHGVSPRTTQFLRHRSSLLALVVWSSSVLASGLSVRLTTEALTTVLQGEEWIVLTSGLALGDVVTELSFGTEVKISGTIILEATNPLVWSSWLRSWLNWSSLEVVVLVDGVSPWTTHTLALGSMTIIVWLSWVLLSRLSVLLTTNTPSTVLQGKEWIGFASGLALGWGVTVLSWAEVKISLTIVLVATDP
jgi:hypothetical protein